MYTAHYGLKSKPFELQPDPDYVYMSPGHDRVYTHLQYATREAKGFVVITGEIGSGKTTLIKLLMRSVPEDAEVALLSNTMVAPAQFLKLVCREFGLELHARDKADVLSAFARFLRERRAASRRVILIIDEAQNLPPRTIEEVRLLSNLETDREQLLQILLVGQPELRTKLRQRGMEQVLQRVSVHCHLEPLNADEVRQYVQHRLQTAGAADLSLFEEEALEALYRYSGGIPRLINVLCDTALVFAYGDEKPRIDRALMEEVAEARRSGSLFDDDTPPRRGPGVGAAADDRPTAELKALRERIERLEADVAGTRAQAEKLSAWFRQLVGILRRAKEGADPRRVVEEH